MGFTAFAGLMLVLVGLYHFIAGIAALVHNEFYVVTTNYVFSFNVTAWGWIHLIAGVIVFFAGIGVFSGAMWARMVGVLVALLSGIANFMFLPYYPLWSILIIAVDVAVIWALTAHGRDITEA
ncbi:MAG: DUF7144 family membrane protein [Thermoleophilia bacterium]